MSDSDVDDAVASLPEQARRRIDEAFDRAISESRPEEKQRPRKRRRIEQDAQPGPSTEPPELAGGFLLDDNNNDGSDNADPIDAIFEDDDDNKENENALSSTSQPPTHIPLALIPRAFQLLDLDPSDAQVLSVFKNAASSWSDESKEERRRPRRARHFSNLSDMDEDEDDESEAEQEVVSRRDWRAVCAALIPSGHPMDSPLSSIEESDNDGDTRAVPEEESDSGSSAVDTGELEESDTSSDEYIPDSKRKAKAKGKSNTRPSQSKKSSPSKKSRQSKAKNSPADISTLTSRQRQDILSAFALFFPSNPKGTRTDVSEEELSLCKKRLTIKDIANAAASIKEKITAEEIIEMLTYCSPSSTQNPTMSFQDFQQMMIAARLA